MFHNSFMNSKQVLVLENSNKVDDKWLPLKVLIHFLFMQIGSEIQKGKKTFSPQKTTQYQNKFYLN